MLKSTITSQILRCALFLSVAMGFFLMTSEPIKAETYVRMVRKVAPKMIQELKGYKSVGVLKFHLVRGKSPTQETGPLLVNMARQLEVALLLANSKEGPMILKEASTAAATIEGADHLSPEGRQRLFFGKGGRSVKKFLPAWGKNQMRTSADAFVTGMVILDENNPSKMKVCFLVFDRTNTKLRYLLPEKYFVFDTTANTLVEAGISFSLRGAYSRNKGWLIPVPKKSAQHEKTQEAFQNAKEVKQGSLAQHPYQNLPVSLEIRYDGQPVPVKLESGELVVPPPQLGQKISFYMERRDNAFKGKFGVVLMVNGVNTANMERFPPEKCTFWVFAPNAEPGIVEGFYANNTRFDFKVIPPALLPPRQRTYYGEDLGKITFAVFAEKAGSPQTLPPGTSVKVAENKKAEQAFDDVIAMANLPQEADTLQEAQQMVKAQAFRSKSQSRNPIVPGQAVPEQLQELAIENPGLVDAITITYYRPK